MTTWPTIYIPGFETSGEDYKPQIRTEFEAGYVQSRPRFTGAAKRRMTLRWASMPEADFQTFRQFFSDYQGETFTLTDPIDGDSITIRFSGDTISWSPVEGGHRRVEVAVEEV